MTAGEVLILSRGLGTEEQVVIQSVDSGTQVTLTAAPVNAHPVGDTVLERVSFTTALLRGYPQLTLPTTVAVNGIKPNSAITVTDVSAANLGSDTANIIECYRTIRVIVVDDLLRDNTNTLYSFAGADYAITSSRNPDSLEIQVLDRTGNDSDDTDATGNGVPNGDEIGWSSTAAAFGVF
jgi:hypothetical protein